MKHEVGILWFRNDLRLHDHAALQRILATCQQILPVYCLDPREDRELGLGFAKRGAFRRRFLIESLADLQAQLRKKGSDLLVLEGKPEEVIPHLAQQYGAKLVVAHKEVTSEEVAVESELEAQLFASGIDLELGWGSTLYHVADLPMPVKSLPEIFTQFRKQVEKFTEVREIIPTPTHIPTPAIQAETIQLDAPLAGAIDERSVLPFQGGERAAMARLNQYFWEQDLLKTYKETRNGLIGADYSSKFSAWLSLGCMSPRYIYQQVKQYEAERKKNSSTYWLIFELIWRDFFRFIARKHGNRLFLAGGLKGVTRTYRNRKEDFEAWMTGNTGFPFIDANMRELKLTGFMSNRGRQNVASFLVHDLNIDWRWGAAYFESQLLDYDVCSNWGNWNYVAGIGNDPRENRYFNILSQAKRYDGQGEYLRLWLPELADLPTPLLYDPGSAARSELAQYGIYLGTTYPQPIVRLGGKTAPVR